jgi:two-component system, chemotaxis family, protein-glutamate methylesterase/glutaminase
MTETNGNADASDPRSRAFEIVALASSAGGLNALAQVLSALPEGFPVAIVVVQHTDPRHHSYLAEILGRRTRLHVCPAAAGDRLVPGTVFVAPPDHHLLVEAGGTLRLVQTERVHFVRPSADRLFGSVAESFGPRAIAVVLTGTGSDGADGVRAIKQGGGTVVVQDASSAEHFGMPGAAIKTGCVDRVLPLDRIAPALIHLVRSGVVDESS